MRKEDSKAVLNKISLYFHCPGCNSLPNWPITLPCGGTVCRDCFRDSYTYSGANDHITLVPSKTCLYKHLRPHYSVETETKDVTLAKVIDWIQSTQEKLEQMQTSPLNDSIYSENSKEVVEFYTSKNTSSKTLWSGVNMKEEAIQDSPTNRSDLSLPDIRKVDPKLNIQEALSIELECQICFGMLYDPVVTPCGHTFCGPCIMQALTQSPQCPTCRSLLPSPVVLEHAKSRCISAFLQDYYPVHWLERQKSWEEEKEQESWLPLFICMVAYPRMPTFLHIFELRYHIMIKKCLESSKRFCMAMPLRPHNDGRNEHRELRNARGQRLFCSEYGTILEIMQVEPLIDGRNLVEARGSYSVRIIDFRADGLFPRVKIEKHFDTPLRATPLQFPEPEYLMMYGHLSNEELVNRVDDFYMNARRTYVHWVVPLIDIKAEARNSISDLSYKITNLLPISELEKTRILQVDNPTDRLVLVLIWLTQLQNSWWYRIGSACTIA
ncbi:ubiquitin-protein ligase E3 [Schizosaccharomyces cryophilus OY26]|uniref:Ubiquitin-protein ligase E3 n=1 Tax=Schizosaccharomyces cryophilus (strain OY26 / ATCC MYA-4695 / CBS 11777 / NBRC 106824 / NRRL Y48691) TaxID=653667 RepID=S9X0A4_SCHCR|nr:ubiquitin-protein ligase E3 [Schizosaccharomyces cryophilus OY26]EPY50382.1 ubiquitin-protein ligase E3 [Schizosaccharomyces cryophilus OY26]